MGKSNALQEAEDFDFRGRRENEKVVVVVKYHAWLLMPIVYIWLIAFALMAGSFYLFGASKVTSIAITVLVVSCVLNTVYRWFIWNAGNYIITNQRVIRIEQLSLFNREISEAEIDRIQEISTEIRGPIHTLFGFGTVKIQTASNTGKVDLEDITKPYDIQQIIAGIQKSPKDLA
ncbi:PH domain-containing protein [Candidatus Berkelbacteria bacterium]|nr:PH domain-containing protein [Candidatus Berkelbacteria bacterium]